ncbi:MAG TPA: hypothetical protein VNA13_02260 [Xanthomonadales bacterium]|nr:hypothetical protein [Xanthomonadales bacterium]
MSEMSGDSSDRLSLPPHDEELANQRESSPIPDRRWKIKPALTKIAALSIATLLGSLQSPPGEQGSSSHGRSNYDPDNSLLSPDKITQLEQQYPTPSSSEYASRIYPEVGSTESMVLYRQEGLEGLSFARPSLEVSHQILEAESITDIEKAAGPFFESLGMNLYMSKIHPETGMSIVPVQQEDLEYTRSAMLSTMNEISITPLEVIKYANIADVVFAHDIFINKGQAAGIAYMKAAIPGILAIDVTDGHHGLRDTWHHEMGHHLDHALSALDSGDFRKVFAQLNLPGFIYKDQVLMPNVVDEGIQRKHMQGSLAEGALSSEYSGVAKAEDIAEIYHTLWSGEGAPDPKDKSYETRIGAKRVLWIETLDKAIPGFKKYLVGLFSEAKYAYESVPTSEEVYARMANQYLR